MADISTYIPYDESFTIEEFIDFVQNELTVSCSLPKTLPNANIRLIIERRALPFFYRAYQYAVQEFYYFVSKEAFYTEEFSKYSFIQLPCEIQAISYIYQVRNESLFSIGLNTPNLSVNLGFSNQPYLSSYVTTIGDIGVYKTIIDGMADMLNQMTKYTIKYNFNYLTHRLHILTDMRYDLVLECFVNIPPEDLFKDGLFYKYVVGWSKIQLGNLYGRYDYTLPGAVKIQASDLVSQGQNEVKEVEETISKQSTSGWFYMVKK